MPSVDFMLKKEKNEDANAMYHGFSQKLNDLINLYFSIENEGKFVQCVTCLFRKHGSVYCW